VVRAILEGVAFSLRESFTIFDEVAVPVHAVRLGGGGARSPLWRQVQADVYGREVGLLEAEEGAAYGAALLAGVGAGVWPSVDAACDAVVRVVERVVPDPQAAATLGLRYEAFRALYGALKGVTRRREL
jgi:xylulokinase